MSDGRLIDVRAREDGANSWSFSHIAAPASLAGQIDGYCDYRESTGFTTRRELPHAEGVLILNLGPPIEIVGGDGGVLRLRAGEAFFAGPHLRPALSRSGGSQAGVHVYLPLSTLRRLIGAPMSEFLDRVAPLDAFLGAEARALGQALGSAPDRDARVRLLDAALARALGSRKRLDPQQAYALRVLRERPELDVAAVAREIGWSRKHLAARVRDAVGVGPRCFRRLLRFQRLVGAVRARRAPPDWAGLAQDAGYCDQSHMIREFGEFSGLSPCVYWERLAPGGGGLIEA
jgi:AraC-like DNA-binding protein